MKLKQLIKENNLGELPSDKLFKYNKSTGKFDKPKALKEDVSDYNFGDVLRKLQHYWKSEIEQSNRDTFFKELVSSLNRLYLKY